MESRRLGRLGVATLALACPSIACAQLNSECLRMNELFVNHCTTSDEFVEIKGQPGTLLDDYVFAVVDGDGVAGIALLRSGTVWFDYPGRRIGSAGPR